ncbi:MAG: hypothetical protein RLY97_1784 [Pseudomonadota bacterium]|jgi:hypothetical protein
MNLPKIDVSSLPDLTELVGMFGSHHDAMVSASSDDTIIILMVFIYEALLPYW